MFKEKAKGRWNFPLALCFSLLLMCLDKFYPVTLMRYVFSILTYPVQYAIALPKHILNETELVWSSKKALASENQRLKEQQLILKANLQQFLMLQDENERLKALLNLADETKHKTIPAEILALSSTHTRQLLTINKGKKHGIKTGQLVIDTEGMVGQVIEVGFLTSHVLLISDVASAVPVRNQRTGETAILTGTNHFERLALIHLPKTAEVKVGDMLLTSGLGQRYPAGYPVGRVEAVNFLPGEAFIQVDVKPLTRYYRNKVVLVVSVVVRPETKESKKV